MEEDLKTLQEKIKRIKLKKELEKLEPKKEEKKENQGSSIKREITELENKREELKKGKGFKNFLAKANLNYQINQRKQIINTEAKLKGADALLKLKEKQIALANANKRLNEARKSNSVNFDPFSSSQPKQIKFEDLY